jgi:hypothetical protein
MLNELEIKSMRKLLELVKLVAVAVVAPVGSLNMISEFKTQLAAIHHLSLYKLVLIGTTKTKQEEFAALHPFFSR